MTWEEKAALFYAGELPMNASAAVASASTTEPAQKLLKTAILQVRHTWEDTTVVLADGFEKENAWLIMFSLPPIVYPTRE